MPSKPLSIAANAILPPVTMLCTAGLFFLFMPENAGKLFYTNLVFTLFLETIFFYYLYLLRKGPEALSFPMLAAIGVSAIYYIACCGIWILAYSLFLFPFLSFKAYMALHIIMILLWVIGGTIVAQFDNAYKERAGLAQEKAQELNLLRQRMKLIVGRYQHAMRTAAIVPPDGGSQLEILCNKIGGIPPHGFRNEANRAQLETLIDQCGQLLETLEKAETTDEIRKCDESLRLFARKAAAEIDRFSLKAKK